MAIKVYIWNYQGSTQAWGHASMSLSDDTYISWWPAGGDERKSVKGNAVKAPPTGSRTLGLDISIEKRKPDVTYTIPSGYINEEAIKIWWKSFSKKENWNAVHQNCSTVVFKALCEGSALALFTAAEKLKYNSTDIGWTPKCVDEFVKLLLEHIREKQACLVQPACAIS